MACNSCAKSFTLFRSEKGCPNCDFSYCSKCLNNKVFLQKLNSEVMVCSKCKQVLSSNKPKIIEAPDAYYKRVAITDNIDGNNDSTTQNSVDKEISERLKKLKDDKINQPSKINSEDVADRLQKLKGETPSTSDAELRSRLANIKGVPISVVQSEVLPKLSTHQSKTEQEQVEDLMKQYLEQGTIDKKYEEGFDGVVSNIEDRLQMLRGSQTSEPIKTSINDVNYNSDNEDETIKKIIEKVKAEAKLEDREIDPSAEELPFCEICNEDAVMRCLGCKYLFCQQCFKDHEDSDDGCDEFVKYSPPKNFEL